MWGKKDLLLIISSYGKLINSIYPEQLKTLVLERTKELCQYYDKL